jgi:hypothetical protein
MTSESANIREAKGLINRARLLLSILTSWGRLGIVEVLERAAEKNSGAFQLTLATLVPYLQNYKSLDFAGIKWVLRTNAKTRRRSGRS